MRSLRDMVLTFSGPQSDHRVDRNTENPVNFSLVRLSLNESKSDFTS